MIKPKVDMDLRHTEYCVWVIRIGCIDIANIFSPRKGERDYYIVKILFEQERGNIDFSKDKHFNTMEECTSYVNERYKKLIRCLASHLHTVKPFNQ